MIRPVRRRAPRRSTEERDSQVAVVEYLRARRLLFCAVPNGGARDAVAGARLKAEGVERGVPDLLIFEPCAGHVGLAIEMKTPNGRVTDDQEWWHHQLRRVGWRVEVCRSAGEALRILEICYP